MIETPRLRLHEWHDRHLEAFQMMHGDPTVMADLRGPIDRSESSEKFKRYRLALREHGVTRWAVENMAGEFLGYAGVMLHQWREHPLGVHFDVSCRFMRKAWGYGYATESLKAALHHAATELQLSEIFFYRRPDNLGSQGIERKLKLVRDPARDFVVRVSDHEQFHWLVSVVPPQL
ncbi:MULTISPECIES: GNAT family N-acetyltransferase [unclassified Bradyrhizobium]|uniref:GNAT family N-acetyltransferase n=1 Tax=unclassified Bradyrhizobium TaxID=2631580 RepID=UPI002916F626|nr:MULTISPECIES: GNAT family N-acetyltransferase [unclassified Bradyrhizobium]